MTNMMPVTIDGGLILEQSAVILMGVSINKEDGVRAGALLRMKVFIHQQGNGALNVFLVQVSFIHGM